MKQLTKNEEIFLQIIHDLKIPTIAQTCALKTLLNILNKKISSDETELLELALNSGNYLNGLIDTFLCVLKLQDKNFSINYDYFDFRELFEETLNNFQIFLKYNNLKVKIISDSNTVIFADKIHIKRVIENIIANAVNIAYKNSIIEMKIRLSKREFIFEAIFKSQYSEDNYFNEIVEQYKFSSSIHAFSGFKLGIYLSKEIIKHHFGKMIIKNNINDTCILGFCLPVR